MNATVKFRVAAFVAAIVLAAGMLVWAAQSTWQRFQQLRVHLTQGQFQSFQTADQFQAHFADLDRRLLLYALFHDQTNGDIFKVEWKKLDEWIDVKNLNLTTGLEKQVLDQINRAYDDYHAAALNYLAAVDHAYASGEAPRGGGSLREKEFAAVEGQSQRILKLSLDLVEAHNQAMDEFLARSKTALLFFRYLIYAALFFLLVMGAWLAVMVYREMIAPLRVKLVESQSLLERHEKLASLGMLAAGIAHEIRNPLTAIKAWLFIHQKHLQPGTPEFADAEVIAREINRLERIVKDFLLFARPSEPELKVIPADQPLREVQAFLAPSLEKAGIRLLLEESGPAHIKVDRQQIKQVLINLVQNAADSIGQNGAVTLRARLDTKRIADGPAPVVILEVADTGKGIPPEVEKRLFDPFFTTKEGGTGLGLSIAARIVEKHGGALQYQTQVNHGTTFGIVLPRADAA